MGKLNITALATEHNLSPSEIKKVAQRMADIIDFMDANIPTGKYSDDGKIIAFEKIMKFIKKENPMRSNVWVGLCTIHKFLLDKKDRRFAKYNSFFKKVHGAIRKKAESHQSYKDNLIIINENNFKCTSREFSKYANMHSFYPMSYDDAHQAYQKVLDLFDPNKNDRIMCNWNGFTALIETSNATIIGCYLGETNDVEYFYRSLTKIIFENAKTATRQIVTGNITVDTPKFISVPCDEKTFKELYAYGQEQMKESLGSLVGNKVKNKTKRTK